MKYTDKQKERIEHSKKVAFFHAKPELKKRTTLQELKERKANRGSKK